MPNLHGSGGGRKRRSERTEVVARARQRDVEEEEELREAYNENFKGFLTHPFHLVDHNFVFAHYPSLKNDGSLKEKTMLSGKNTFQSIMMYKLDICFLVVSSFQALPHLFPDHILFKAL